MNATIQNPAALHVPTSRARVWTGRVITGLLATFLIWDAAMKLVLHPMVIEASAKLGIRTSTIFGIGLVLLFSVIVHLIPRTAVVGAVLLTGYLGGAICTHVLHGDGAFSIVFAATFAVLVWLGLWLRDERVSALFTPRDTTRARAGRA